MSWIMLRDARDVARTFAAYSGQLNAVYSVDELEDEDIDDMIGPVKLTKNPPTPQ